jgi:hypothetical protein
MIKLWIVRYKKILSVEDMSWKQNWRSQIGQTLDADLLWAWNASVSLIKKNPEFKLHLLFLELNHQSIAYSMVIQYKGIAIGVKTSFVQKYRKLGVGAYSNNAIIRALFDKEDVKQFDFLTNLHYMGIWTHKCLPRVKYTINKRTPSNLVLQVLQNSKKSSLARKINSKLQTNLSF